MNEHESYESYRREVEKRLNRLIKYIQRMEDPDERRASTAFCVANLVLQNGDEIEGLGLLEKVKDVLNGLDKRAKPSGQFTKLSYIS